MSTIQARGLTKRFGGGVLAVDHLDFDALPGGVTGFLGPNGAGKTTTLRMLLGLVSPTSGSVLIDGRDYRHLPNPTMRVGAVLEASGFHPARTARNHLRLIATVAGIPFGRVDECLDLVGLSDAGNRKVGGFSMGMRQRLELARALLGRPDILVLDEPANGLDPQGIAWLREFLRYLAGEGRTVLVSSHLLAEMSQTVDDVVIIADGRARASGPLASLTSQVRAAMRVRTPEADRLLGVMAAAHWTSRRLAHDLVLVESVTPDQLGPVLARSQIVVYELVNQSTDLESVFLSLTANEPVVQPVTTSPGQPSVTPP
jgi:ABC-2 type transport system ATP-binding protein